MELFKFYTAYTQLEDLYGVKISPDEFENVGMIAYGKIGNKNTMIKEEVLPIDDDGIVTMPCDIASIESVTTCRPDYQRTGSTYDSWNNIYNSVTEQYIEHFKHRNNPLYTKGRYVKYKQIDERRLYIAEKLDRVHVMYKVNVLDEDDLPLLNKKELDAIAAYCAYIDTFKKGLSTRDGNMLNIATQLEQKWLTYLSNARTPESMSQNDLDAIGDVKTSWDRKTYGKSFKGLK